MPVDVDFSYNNVHNVLIGKLSGSMRTLEEADEVFHKVEQRISQVGKKCWFVSDVRELDVRHKVAIHYSKLTKGTRGTRLGTVSIATKLIHRTGMKLVGTFRAEKVHLASSLEEAYEIIDKLDNT